MNFAKSNLHPERHDNMDSRVKCGKFHERRGRDRRKVFDKQRPVYSAKCNKSRKVLTPFQRGKPGSSRAAILKPIIRAYSADFQNRFALSRERDREREREREREQSVKQRNCLRLPVRSSHLQVCATLPSFTRSRCPLIPDQRHPAEITIVRRAAPLITRSFCLIDADQLLYPRRFAIPTIDPLSAKNLHCQRVERFRFHCIQFQQIQFKYFSILVF